MHECVICEENDCFCDEEKCTGCNDCLREECSNYQETVNDSYMTAIRGY